MSRKANASPQKTIESRGFGKVFGAACSRTLGIIAMAFTPSEISRCQDLDYNGEECHKKDYSKLFNTK